MANFKIIIVGSGLAGNLLACGLINNNIEVQVYERQERHAVREGYQIRLGASALMGFRACLTKDHKHRIIEKFGRADGKLASAPVVYSPNFKPVLDLNALPNYDLSAPISRKILRDLLAEPVDKAGKLHYNKSFERYEVLHANNPQERIRVWFSDGTSEDCDLLIGADGARSKVNAQVGLDNLRTVDSHLYFLTKCDLPTEKFLRMSPELRKSAWGITSHNRVLFFAPYLPDRPSDTEASTHTTTSQIPDFDDSLSSCFFALSIPVEETPKDINKLPLHEQWDFISKILSNWSPKVQEIVDLLRSSELYIYHPRASIRPSSKWRIKVSSAQDVTKGHRRVWLIGDAVHAMLPNRGMGGNQSLRDASVLLPILLSVVQQSSTEFGSSNDAIAVACKKYEDEMLPRGFEWVQKSGGLTVTFGDVSTWKGYLQLKFLGWVLGMAYYADLIFSPFIKPKYVDETPEFKR